MKVIAIPKFVFDKKINVELIKKTKEKTAYISILDEDNKEENFKGASKNFLQVRFYDIEEDLYEEGCKKYSKPSDNELKKIVEFVRLNSDKELFIVHCSAGISRSGAVSRFISEYFEIPNKDFIKDNPRIMPNLYVLNRLKELNKL